MNFFDKIAGYDLMKRDLHEKNQAIEELSNAINLKRGVIEELYKKIEDLKESSILKAYNEYSKTEGESTYSNIVGLDGILEISEFYKKNKALFEYLHYVKDIPEIKRKHEGMDFYEWLFMGCYLEIDNKKRKKDLNKKKNSD